jgi:hypothetical protein
LILLAMAAMASIAFVVFWCCSSWSSTTNKNTHMHDAPHTPYMDSVHCARLFSAHVARRLCAYCLLYGEWDRPNMIAKSCITPGALLGLVCHTAESRAGASRCRCARNAGLSHLLGGGSQTTQTDKVRSPTKCFGVGATHTLLKSRNLLAIHTNAWCVQQYRA